MLTQDNSSDNSSDDSDSSCDSDSSTDCDSDSDSDDVPTPPVASRISLKNLGDDADVFFSVTVNEKTLGCAINADDSGVYLADKSAECCESLKEEVSVPVGSYFVRVQNESAKVNSSKCTRKAKRFVQMILN